MTPTSYGAGVSVGASRLTGLGDTFARDAGVLDNCGWIELEERTMWFPGDEPSAEAGVEGRWRLTAYNRSVASIADLMTG